MYVENNIQLPNCHLIQRSDYCSINGLWFEYIVCLSVYSVVMTVKQYNYFFNEVEYLLCFPLQKNNIYII